MFNCREALVSLLWITFDKMHMIMLTIELESYFSFVRPTQILMYEKFSNLPQKKSRKIILYKYFCSPNANGL